MLIIHSHLAWANSSHFITLSMFSWNFPQIQMLDKIRRTPVGMVKPLIIFMICSIWPNAGFLSINNIIISFGKHGQTGYTLWEMVVLMQHPPVGSSARICKFCFIFTHVFFFHPTFYFCNDFSWPHPEAKVLHLQLPPTERCRELVGIIFCWSSFFQHPSGFRILCGLGFRLQVIRGFDSIGEDVSKSVVLNHKWLPSLKRTASLHLKMDGWKTLVSFWGPGWDGYCSGEKLMLVSGRSTSWGACIWRCIGMCLLGIEEDHLDTL